ncbi:hypothetical protein [Priestia megaterium]|uniref:hypothetical protein n=1 Tax=Priestia TaxID=2800373 RepID=UPI0035D70B1A
MSGIINSISENIYWFVFLATLLDHSGLPIPIVTAGTLVAVGKAKVLSLIVIMNTSLALADLIFIRMGIYFKKRHTNRNRFSLFSSLERKAIIFTEVMLSRKTSLFYLFGKFIPYIGKFLPLFMGYKDGINKKSLLLLLVGNNIYICTFYFLGVLFGKTLMEYSIFTTLSFLFIFLLIYITVVNFEKSSWKKDHF